MFEETLASSHMLNYTCNVNAREVKGRVGMAFWGGSFLNMHYPHTRSIYRTIRSRLRCKIQIGVVTTARNSQALPTGELSRGGH